MKVAFIGNTNNHFFAVVRHLRDVGVDAHLLLLGDEAPHFHPSTDTFDLGYQAYTTQLEWGDPMTFSGVPAELVRADLAPYDVLVGCGTSPAFVHAAGRRLDVFLPYGTDILEYPYLRAAAPRRRTMGSIWQLPLNQRRGIRHARVVAGALAPQFEEHFAKLRVRGRRVITPVPPVYATGFNRDSIARYYGQSNWYAELEGIRRRSRLMIFHHARHVWSGRSAPINNKGNDRLVRGFASFVRSGAADGATLVMLEYGPDVVATRRLVGELGIERNVSWFPLMARKELMVGISLCDIVCGEYENSWNFGGTIIEGIAMAKPLLHFRNDALYPEEDLFPIMNVSSPDDIARALREYVSDPGRFAAMGEAAHTWFREHIVERPVEVLRTLVGERR